MYCPVCGSDMPDNSKFCPNCGTSVFDEKNLEEFVFSDYKSHDSGIEFLKSADNARNLEAAGNMPITPGDIGLRCPRCGCEMKQGQQICSVCGLKKDDMPLFQGPGGISAFGINDFNKHPAMASYMPSRRNKLKGIILVLILLAVILLIVRFIL